jgi:hypothetical protein
MNFDGNFVRIGDVVVVDLRRRVAALSQQDWDKSAFRQQRYEVHRDTQTIGLVFDPDFRHSHPTRLPALQIFADAIHPALELAADHFEQTERGERHVTQFGLGYFVRATLVRLKAGGRITPHQDNNFSLAHSHRIHVPVITSENVHFTVGSETIAMREGELYEINNRRLHSVHNGGDADRVHLILDYVLPGEQCCCGRKMHPQTLCSPQACMETDHLRVPCNCYPEAT